MFRRIGHIDATAQDSDGAAVRIQRTLMSRTVDPACQAADYRDPGFRQPSGNAVSHAFAVGAGLPRADDAHHRGRQAGKPSSIVQQVRKIVNGAQPIRVFLIVREKQVNVALFQLFRPCGQFVRRI